MLWLHVLFILGLLYLAYEDFIRRELFMPIVWVLTPITIIIAFLTSLQSLLGLVIGTVTVFVLFLHYRVSSGDRLTFIIFAWYISSVIGNTYQIYMAVPLIVGLILVLLYRIYPNKHTCEFKRTWDLIEGDIVLESYPHNPTRVLVYRGKPFVTLLLFSVILTYLCYLLFVFLSNL